MTERPISILHLEDSPQDAEIIGFKLVSDGLSCDVRVAGDRDSFTAALVQDRYDVILCDYNLPDFDGLDAIRLVKAAKTDAPVIVISGTVGEEEAVRCLQAGATDYLLKGHLERLGSAVRRAIREAEERRKRLQAEAALLERERRLSSIYAAVADILFDIDVEADGRFRFASVNPAFVSATGFDYDQVVGKPVVEVLPPSSLDLALENYRRAIAEKRIVSWEETSDYPRGRLIGEVRVTPVFDASGTCTQLVGAIHDVTERRRLEAELRQAQKVESVGQLAGGIAHDFNNLLTVINGMSDLLLAEVTDNGRIREDLKEIKRAGERAAALTRQLLAFSRKQILQPQLLDLNKTVVEMGNLLRRLLGEDIELLISASGAPATVKADPGQIEQVIVNIAVNARDAMPDGGTLTIETRMAEVDEAFVGSLGFATAPGRYVVLALRDTGTGMDEATRQQIFDPFFTTKGVGKGTGLGLSTVYGIVKQSGGFIIVDSALGRGSCFSIYLPHVVDALAPRPVRPVTVEGRGTETILVVEDVAGLRRLLTRTLESAGYRVLVAATGDEALRILEQHAEPVHLLLTDVVMPGMSGRTLAERLERTRPQTGVIFMSGYTDDVVTRHGVLEPGIRFINKPFATKDLLRTVREVLDQA